jgi:hypothetical protein
VENPTQALKPFKGPGNTFELTPKLERTLPCFGNISWDIHIPPPPNPNIKIDIWHHAEGLRCRITQSLKLVNGLGNTFELNPKWERTLPSFGNFSCDIHSPPSKSKYRSWYLTPCCGLEVQNPTQSLKSVKGPGNTFELCPKWDRTLPSFSNFSWDIHSPPNPNIKVDIWHPAVGLRCRISPRHLSQLKARPIPLT